MREEGVLMLPQGQSNSIYAYTEVASLHDLERDVREHMMWSLGDIALVTITLQFGGEEAGMSGARYFLENVRSLVRKTDQVFLLGTTFYFLLPGANQEGAAIVQERLWEALLWRIHNCEREDIARPIWMKSGRGTLKVRPSLERHDFWPTLSTAVEEQNYFQFEFSQTEPYIEANDEEELTQRARQLGIPYLPLLPRTLPTRVRRLIDPQLGRELHCYPLGRERNVLTVAMADPQDEVALRRLQQVTGLTIYPVLTSMQELRLVW